jgi:F0F1-type ATP synthase membrane subunit b/b'
VFFTQHIRKPISELIAAAERVTASGSSEAGRLAAAVKAEGAEIMATLKGLEEEIGELQAKGDRLKRGDLSLEDLEKRHQKHLRDGKKQPEASQEASG